LIAMLEMAGDFTDKQASIFHLARHKTQKRHPKFRTFTFKTILCICPLLLAQYSIEQSHLSPFPFVMN